MNKDNRITIDMYLTSIKAGADECDLMDLPDEAMEHLESLLKEADDATWALKEFTWED